MFFSIVWKEKKSCKKEQVEFQRSSIAILVEPILFQLSVAKQNNDGKKALQTHLKQ